MSGVQPLDGDDEGAGSAQILVVRRAVSREDYWLVARLVAMFGVILILVVVMGPPPTG